MEKTYKVFINDEEFTVEAENAEQAAEEAINQRGIKILVYDEETGELEHEDHITTTNTSK